MRGELWRADLGEPEGHEQAGVRPVIILQTDHLSRHPKVRTVVVVPLTSKDNHAGRPYAVDLSQPNQTSVVLCHQIRALDVGKLICPLQMLPPAVLAEIEARTRFVLGL